MKKLVVLLLLVCGSSAFADLLDRVRLEEALRARLEQVVQTKDARARVLARVEYRKFDTDLPGTRLTGDLTPSRLELSDISKLEIDVYTDLADLDAPTKKKLMDSAHVAPRFVKLNVHKIESLAAAQQRAIEAKDLADIAARSVTDLTRETRLFLGGFMALLAVAFAGAWFLAQKRMKEFKDQMAVLANAISEGGGGGARSFAPPTAAAGATAGGGSASSSSSVGGERLLKDVPPKAVAELFADAYWTKNDGYANWLWKNLDSEQRESAIATLPFMAEYSLAFIAAPPVQAAYHEHPFYMNPVSCAHLSQSDVDAAVQKDLAIWHRLSPMRQSASTLPLQSKVKAVATKPKDSFKWPSSASAARKLDANMDFGQISFQDEEALFETPNLAPVEMRANIRSLVWLAHRNENAIRDVLARFDARSLASAWVASEPVLKKLESCIPEKKLKLLRMHVEKSVPTRQSAVYDSLVQEGLRDEAA